MLLGGDREKAIDHVYSVYFSENDMMLSDKYFDVDTNDFMRWSKGTLCTN